MKEQKNFSLAISLALFSLSIIFTGCSQPPAVNTPVPTPIGGGGKIGFASNINGNYDIYTINPDGTDLTRLTEFQAEDMGGDFSPDGKYIAFWSYETFVSPPESNFWIMKSDGSEKTKFGPGAGKVSWSPDGELFLFNWIPPESDDFDIISVTIDKKEGTRLTTTALSDTTPDWSPDGKSIAFTSFREGIPQIYLMNADGSDQHRLTTGKMPEYGPAWSPNGKKIAFWTQNTTGAQSQVYVVNIDGIGLQKLTDTLGLNDGPSWSPDGIMLVFSSNRTGNRELYLMNPDGSGLVQLTYNSAEDLNPFWSK